MATTSQVCCEKRRDGLQKAPYSMPGPQQEPNKCQLPSLTSEWSMALSSAGPSTVPCIPQVLNNCISNERRNFSSSSLTSIHMLRRLSFPRDTDPPRARTLALIHLCYPFVSSAYSRCLIRDKSTVPLAQKSAQLRICLGFLGRGAVKLPPVRALCHSACHIPSISLCFPSADRRALPHLQPQPPYLDHHSPHHRCIPRGIHGPLTPLNNFCRSGKHTQFWRES